MGHGHVRLDPPLMKVQKELYGFQEEVVPLLAERNFLLADDAGMGKTLMATEAAIRHAEGPILVISPKPVREWWKQEIEERGGGYVGVCGPGGRGIPWSKVRGGHPLLWVVVHPTAVRMAWRDMATVDWDWVIVDEAHRFKNRKAKQTKALWKIDCNHKVALTATPYGKDPSDLWALAHWLYPSGPPDSPKDHRKLFTSYWKWFNTFVEAFKPRGRHYHIIKGPQNLSYLADVIAPFYRRRRKEDVLDLPPLTYKDVPVRLNEDQVDLYSQLVKQSYAAFKGQEVVLENVLVRLLRLQQASASPGLFVEGWSERPAKVEWIQEWLEDHPAEPVVLVSRFRKFVEKYLVPMAGSSAGVIVGGMGPEDTRRELDKFERSGRIVGSLQAIAEGLNLQRASTIIIADGTYSPTLAYQMAQRIHRIGQQHPCQVMHLVGTLPKGKYTVDKLVRRAQTKRWSQARMLNAFVREVLDAKP